MHVPAPGAAGWITRSPGLSRSEEAVSFVLANGQSDSYPLAWTYARAEALLAAEYFIDHGGRAPWMEWHEDSPPADSLAAGAS
ncbi:MAG TPA: hypothetical protein VGE07_14300 [Herpetosiphonaceae bacterium]